MRERAEMYVSAFLFSFKKISIECGIKRMKYRFLMAVLVLSSFIPGVLWAVNQFDPNVVFPTWDQVPMQGVIGKNAGSLKDGESRLILYFIPHLINILLKVVGPLVAVMFIFAGIRFIYAGDTDDQLEASKKFFHHVLMGIVFIVLSYSIMKAVYFLFL